MLKPLNPTRSHERAVKYFMFLHKFRYPINIGVALLTAFCIFLTAKLTLKTDFSELLPEKLESVQYLRKAATRIGGTGLLLIGVESPDYRANRKFIEAMAAKIRPLVGEKLRYFEYRYNDVVDYAEKYGLHYLNTAQLEKMRVELTSEIQRNKDKAFGSLLGFDDKPVSDPKPKQIELFNSLDPSMRFFYNYKDSYLSADDGKIMVIMLRPKASSLSTSEGAKLTKIIHDYINEINPQLFHPDMKVGLGGNIQSALDEMETVKADIVDTAVLLVVLILGVLGLYFWSFRLVLLIVANLLIAVLWTFGLTQLHIGYLNTQTAFLGSLVVGTGINYGIIFISRYLENRRSRMRAQDAIVDSIANTSISTLIASSTTAVSFVSLLVAENKGLSQFGYIGGIGVVCCWIAAYSLLPLWLYQWDLRRPQGKVNNPLGSILLRPTMWIGDFFTRRAYSIGLVLVVLCLAGIGGFKHLAQDPLEYNFDNLRNKVSLESGTAALEARIKGVFPTSLTPSLVMMDSLDQARELCHAVRKIASELPSSKNVIQSCMSVYEMLPNAQSDNEAHRKKMLELKSLLSNRLLRFSEHGDRLQAMSKNMVLTPPTEKDLPETLLRRFTELDGRTGYIGFVNPNNLKPLNDGRNLLAYTDSLKSIPLENGQKLRASGDSFILADLLAGLKKDGPVVAGIAFGGVFLIAIFLCGGLRNGVFMALCLMFGTWLMLAIQGYLDLKFNFFNFIALPLTFGIGVDYPINVFIRCRQENFKNFGRILATSGGAVILCSSTTIIGYYTLIGAANQALVSFAKLAIIGEFTCLFAAVVLVPVALGAVGKFKESGEESEIGGGRGTAALLPEQNNTVA